MSKRRLYDILGIKPSASKEEIKAAKTRAQKRTHPDAGGSTEEFVKVGRAVAILSDPLKRAKYDATGDENLAGVDNEQGEALSLLGSLFEQLVAKLGQEVVYTDMVGAMKEHLRAEIESATRDIEAHLNAKKLYVFITKKFRKKKGASPLFGLLFEKRLLAFDDAVEKLRYVVKVRETAIGLLDGWTFETDERPRPHSHEAYMAANRQMDMTQGGALGGIFNSGPFR